MKNILKITLLTLGMAALVTSCKKQLSLAPEDYYGENSFWNTPEQVNAYMTGQHAILRGNQFNFFRLGEMRGGTLSNQDVQNTSLNELNVINHNISETSSGAGEWAGFYGPVMRLNLFLDKAPNLTFMDAGRLNYLTGQAYGIRAYYYFHLLRSYGGVPIISAPLVISESDPLRLRTARSTEAEVLAFIKEDIEKSLTAFGAAADADKYQWTKSATNMLKGEVYLWSAKVYGNNADLATAKSTLENLTGFSLQSSFARAFAYNNKKNSEIIFAFPNRVGETEMAGIGMFTYSLPNFDSQHYKDSLASAGVGNFLLDPLNIGQPNSQQIIQRYRYKFELFQAYDIKDKRRNATFYDFYKVNTGSTPYRVTVRNTALVKFLGTIDANKRYFADDYPVYREADRLLMLAEIVNAEGGDPTQYIKAIRDRAFAPDADPAPFVNGSKDQNELAIMAERMKEFVYEGKMWYDIRRMKYAGKALVYKSAAHPYGQINETNTTAPESYKILWPIPQSVWVNDPLVDQTPGYPTTKP